MEKALVDWRALRRARMMPEHATPPARMSGGDRPICNDMEIWDGRTVLSNPNYKSAGSTGRQAGRSSVEGGQDGGKGTDSGRRPAAETRHRLPDRAGLDPELKRLRLVFPQSTAEFRERNGGPRELTLYEYNVPCLFQDILWMLGKSVEVSVECRVM